MRIVNIIGNLNFGGLQELVATVSYRLKERGHFPSIACRSGTNNYPLRQRQLEQAGIPVTVFRRPDDSSWTTFRRLATYLRTEKTDIVHIHTPVSYYPWATLAARWAGVGAVVNTLHATDSFDPMGRKDKALYWSAVLMTDRVVSVSQESEGILRKRFRFPAVKSVVVENGIELAPFLEVPARHQRDEVVFGAVGRLVEVKSYGRLIDAFAVTTRTHPQVRLRFLGEGPDRAALEQQARDRGLANSIDFCGFSPDVAGFLATLDVFVLSSTSEGFPLSLLEAIASGLPVVATTVGGVPGIVRACEAGWLCRPQDVASLATAMDAAVQARDRAARGERARTIAASRYSAERLTMDYEQLYEHLLRA